MSTRTYEPDRPSISPLTAARTFRVEHDGRRCLRFDSLVAALSRAASACPAPPVPVLDAEALMTTQEPQNRHTVQVVPSTRGGGDEKSRNSPLVKGESLSTPVSLLSAVSAARIPWPDLVSCGATKATPLANTARSQPS